jgi:hypothetical protein
MSLYSSRSEVVCYNTPGVSVEGAHGRQPAAHVCEAALMASTTCILYMPYLCRGAVLCLSMLASVACLPAPATCGDVSGGNCSQTGAGQTALETRVFAACF